MSFQPGDQAKQSERAEHFPISFGRRTETLPQFGGIGVSGNRWITVHDELDISILYRGAVNFSGRQCTLQGSIGIGGKSVWKNLVIGYLGPRICGVHVRVLLYSMIIKVWIDHRSSRREGNRLCGSTGQSILLRLIEVVHDLFSSSHLVLSLGIVCTVVQVTQEHFSFR